MFNPFKKKDSPIEEDSADGRFPLTSRNWGVPIKQYDQGVKCVDSNGDSFTVAKTDHGVSISSKHGLTTKAKGEKTEHISWS